MFISTLAEMLGLEHEFLPSRSSKKTVLFLTGGAGCGKSTLQKSVGMVGADEILSIDPHLRSLVNATMKRAEKNGSANAFRWPGCRLHQW